MDSLSSSSWATLGDMSDSQPIDTLDEKDYGIAGDTAMLHQRADSTKTNHSILAHSPASPRREKNAGQGEPVTIVDFDKPFDPADPMQWSPWKKISIVLNIALLSAAGQMASSMVAPSVEQIILDFRTGNLLLAVLIVTVFLVGMAVGLLLTSGISEVYGRVAVIHATNVLFVIFAAAAAVAGSLGQLIGFRFLQGVAAAAPPAVGGGVIGDMFEPKDRGRATSIYGLGMLMGPMVGPIAGGYITESVGWRWNCWVIAIVVSDTHTHTCMRTDGRASLPERDGAPRF